MGIANYFTDPVFRAALRAPPEEDPRPADPATSSASSPTRRLTWDDLAWLREQTSLPILLKGILHPDDAREAVDRGVDGIVVSNHGGRQVDGAIASLDALPGVVEAVGERAAVLFDSGIRRRRRVQGAGAGGDGVLLGRPYFCGLAVGGEAGVREVLRNLLADAEADARAGGLRLVRGGGAGQTRQGPRGA